MSKTVLVIDDHQDLAELVERTLIQEGFDVIIALDGKSGLEIAQQHHPDLIVLDLTMPGLDGLEVCQRLRSNPRTRRVPIIVLSARATEADRVLGLERGADDYLIKPFGPRELVARVNAVLRRSEMQQQEKQPRIAAGDLTIDFLAHQVSYSGNVIPLLPAEFRVLEALAVRPDQTLSRDEIIQTALRSQTAVTERTVDVHITNIRKKLGAGAKHIETVRTVGYKFRQG
jgi:two-component system phosphate regulon response regulator PhoB